MKTMICCALPPTFKTGLLGKGVISSRWLSFRVPHAACKGQSRDDGLPLMHSSCEKSLHRDEDEDQDPLSPRGGCELPSPHVCVVHCSPPNGNRPGIGSIPADSRVYSPIPHFSHRSDNSNFTAAGAEVEVELHLCILIRRSDGAGASWTALQCLE